MSRERPADAGDTITRNTAFALATQITTAVFTAGLTVYLVRALGPDSYGEFALAMAIGLLLLVPSDFGLTASASRFVADHLDDAGAVASVLSDALRLKLVVGLVASGALAILSQPIADAFGEPGLVWPLRGMAVAVFGQGLMYFWEGAFIALRRVALMLRVVLSESAIEATASVALVMLGAGAAGAAFGRATGYAFGALAALVLIYRLLGRRAVAPFGTRGGHGRRIARYAGAMLIIETAFTIHVHVDALVIGAILGTVEVGLYAAPNRLTTMLTYPGGAVATGVAPRMSRAGAGPNVGAFTSALRYLLVLQVAITVAIVIWADPLTLLVLGDEYSESAAVLRALGPYVLVAGLAPLLSIAVNYLGEARRRVPIAIAALLLNLIVDLILVPQIGIVGAAIGTDLAFVFYTGGHLWLCWRLVDLPLRPLAATLARSLVAAVPMALVLLAIGTSGIGAPVLIAGGLASLAVFGCALLLTGEFSRSELAGAGTAVAARLRRRAD